LQREGGKPFLCSATLESLERGEAMSEIVAIPQSVAIAPKLPEARCSVSVRSATAADLTFIDALQKMHTHMVGFFPRKQMESYVEGGHVLIAEEIGIKASRQHGIKGSDPTMPPPGGCHDAIPVGYVIARDQYLKRDDVGIVYQLNVLPLRQRHLVGASLIKATFERAAYGCKLFSCWCAQDIQANWFWESIGFLPLAFRTGSRAKQRIHIFWQRRVRENDDSTPYWFPSQTSAGAVGEDRIVLPIPPGTHWRDAKPVLLPGVPNQRSEVRDQKSTEPKTLPGGALVRPRPETSGGPTMSPSQRAAIIRSQSKHLRGVPPGKAAVVTAGGIRYIERGDFVPEPEPEKPKRERKPRQKNDPKYVAAARELRDRFLEQVNTERLLPAAHGKYDVSRQLDTGGTGVPPVLNIGTGETPVPPLKLKPLLAGPGVTGKLAA
jgi:hypothetical protein